MTVYRVTEHHGVKGGHTWTEVYDVDKNGVRRRVDAPPMTDWQPIESAPKDGTEFLAMWGGRVVVTYWLDNSKTSVPWAGWRVPSGTPLRFDAKPTHWLPLPQPPETQP